MTMKLNATVQHLTKDKEELSTFKNPIRAPPFSPYV